MNESVTAGFSAQLVAADGTRYPLAGEMKVGRTTASDITIEDARVSREHALLRVDGQVVSVEDLGSANGTSVNGRQITHSTVLRSGDQLQFEEHRFTVEISGAEAETDEDLTVVSMPPEDDLTVVSPVVPEPAAAPAAEAAASPPPDLPGSWVDDAVGEHTRFMSVDDIAPSAASSDLQRLSDHAHLMVIGPSGQVQEASELEPAGGSEADTWEIGRDAGRCQIVLGDPSVSASHAQLVHQDGRWKIIKLPGKNPVVINGEQRLSAFLSDGDEIRLGDSVLVFRGPLRASAAPPPRREAAPAAAAPGSAGYAGLSKQQLALAAAGLVVLAVVVVLALF